MLRIIVRSTMAAVLLAGCATAVGRGETALHAGRPEEAARQFALALAADPARVDAQLGLGIARFRLGAWDGAVTVLQAVVEAAPRSPEAHLYLGLAQLMRGDVAAARTELGALRQLPLHPRIAAQLDRVLPLLDGDLALPVRELVAAGLDDAYEWAIEVDAARRLARAPLEPAWRTYWNLTDPATLHGPYGGVPSRP
jgi:Flp pilus assembly protein TadD